MPFTIMFNPFPSRKATWSSLSIARKIRAVVFFLPHLGGTIISVLGLVPSFIVGGGVGLPVGIIATICGKELSPITSLTAFRDKLMDVTQKYFFCAGVSCLAVSAVSVPLLGFSSKAIAIIIPLPSILYLMGEYRLLYEWFRSMAKAGRLSARYKELAQYVEKVTTVDTPEYQALTNAVNRCIEDPHSDALLVVVVDFVSKAQYHYLLNRLKKSYLEREPHFSASVGFKNILRKDVFGVGMGAAKDFSKLIDDCLKAQRLTSRYPHKKILNLFYLYATDAQSNIAESDTSSRRGEIKQWLMDTRPLSASV